MSQGVPIGLKDVYYAFLLTDPVGSVATYAAPVRIPGAISAKVNPNASNATLFADDGPYETSTTIGKIALDLNIADLPIEAQAAIFGHTLAGGVLIRKSGDVPPWLAVGFRSLKSSGGYRYTWLAKGKFSLSEQANETKADSVKFQTPMAVGSFVKRDCDDEWERHIDSDNVDYISSMGTNWFTGPYGGTVDATAPTISSVVPANSATAIAVGASVVWTFDDAMALSTLTKDNFVVVADVTGAAVAGSLSVNATRTIVTFTPTVALSAATAYRAIVTTGVRDIAGNAMVSSSVTKFTTA
jgi:phi13 family phage major tail protein